MNVRLYLRNVGGTMGAVITSPFSSRSRYALSRAIGALEDPPEAPYVPLQWQDVLHDDAELVLGRLGHRPGNAQLYEIAAMCSLVREYNLCSVFEIGSFDGRSTFNFSRSVGGGGQVVTLNLPQERLKTQWLHTKVQRTSGERFHGTPEAGRIVEVFCDSRDYKPAERAGTFGLVFIDGDHSAEMAARDAHLAVELLRRKGPAVIAWHDAHFDTVRAGVHNFLKEKGWGKAHRLIESNLLFTFLIDGKRVEPAEFTRSRATT